MRIAIVVPGGVDRSRTRRVIPHLVERIESLAVHHDVQVVALRQEPEPASWALGGATIWNVGRRPRRVGGLRRLVALHRETALDVIHGFGLVPQGVVAAVAARFLRVPAVLEAPGGEFVSMPAISFGGWRRAPGRMWIRLSTRGGSLFVPSAPAATEARRRGFQATRMPLEIDLEAWKPPPAAPPGPEPMRLLWVGTLTAVKDPRFLLEVAVALKERAVRFRLDVVGEDTLGGEVQSRARRLGLKEEARFAGFLPQAELRQRMARAHVLLVTSQFESGPRVVLEAASQRVPCVGPQRGYIAEWGPEAALPVPQWSPGAVADAVCELHGDATRRTSMGAAALDRLSDHALHGVVARWVAVYEGITETTETNGAHHGGR